MFMIEDKVDINKLQNNIKQTRGSIEPLFVYLIVLDFGKNP